MNTNKILVQKLWLYGDVDKASFISYISLPDQNLVITIIGRITVVFMFRFCPTIASMILAPHRNTSSVNIFDIAFTVMGQNKHFHKLWTQFVEPSNSSIVGHQRCSCHCRERHWTSWSLSSECCWYWRETIHMATAGMSSWRYFSRYSSSLWVFSILRLTHCCYLMNR